MIRILTLLIAAICFFVAGAADTIKIIDGSDNSPVTGATIIGQSGMILGITDNTGQILISDDRNFPITIRCVGYETQTASANNTTVRLTPATYQLNEVMIIPADRPITRVVCFAREYSSGITGRDTIQFYCEYMAESFLVDGKVKGYRRYDARPTPKNIRRYARITKEGCDSIFRPKYDDDINELSWFNFMAFLPDKNHIRKPEAIKNGAESDTVSGKYGPKFIYRKKNNIFTKTADMLSNHKTGSGPLFYSN